nr:ribonuclease H [Ipomoea batatas]
MVDDSGTRVSDKGGHVAVSPNVGSGGEGRGLSVAINALNGGNVCIAHMHANSTLAKGDVGVEHGVVIVEQKRRRVEENEEVEGGQVADMKIDRCGRELMKWGKGRVRDFGGRLDRCRRRMESLRTRQDVRSQQELMEVQDEYLGVLAQQSAFWKQRAKELWYKEGDLNTKFFHNSVKSRRRRNLIKKLRDDDGNWVSGSPELGLHMAGYFEELFTSHQGDMHPILECVTDHVTALQNEALMRPVTAMECLPTAAMLRTRRVECPVECRLCHEEEESAWHIFFRCRVAIQCWQKAGVAMVSHGCETLELGMQYIFESLEGDVRCFSLMICWSLWACRNDAVWRGGVVTVDQVINTAHNVWHGWRQANGIAEEPEQRGCLPQPRWCRPERGRWKVNVDAAFLGRTGVGMVIRDDEGGFVAAKAMPGLYTNSAREAEAVGGSRGVELAEGARGSKRGCGDGCPGGVLCTERTFMGFDF